MAIANADGSIVLTTKVDQSGLKKGMSTMKSGVSSLIGSFGKLATAIGVAFSVGALVKFSKEASNLATTAEASVQRLIDIYGSASQAVGDFIDANAQALGMSRAAAASYASVYGNLFSVWADQQTNAALTTQYLQMTAVVASKTGRTVEDVQERIRSGLLGNTEAIEDLGIFVNVKTIEMTDAFRRMADGQSWEQLDAYTQQQIRSMAILEQATAKYGDEVAQTTAMTKSQFRAAWQDFQATWGQVVNRVLMPILEVLTDILVSATAVMQALFNISGSTISQSDAISDATENQEGLTEAVKETEKATKKALAGFDETQILSSEAEKGASSSGVGLPEIAPIQGETSSGGAQIYSSLEPVYEILKQISDLFMTGFWKGFVNVDFAPIKTALNEISYFLQGIFTSAEVVGSLNQFGLTLITVLGQITGAIASVGMTLATNLLGGFSIYLEGNSEFIKSTIANIFNATSHMLEVVGDMWTAFANIFSVFASEEGQLLTSKILEIFINGSLKISEIATTFAEEFMYYLSLPLIENQETIKNILLQIIESLTDFLDTIITNISDTWQNIEGALGQSFDNIGELWNAMWSDMFNVLNEWTTPILEAITQLFDDIWDTAIDPVISLVVDAWNDFTQTLLDLWLEYGEPLLENIMEFVYNVIDLFQSIYDNIIEPIITPFLEELQWLWDEHISKMIEKLGEFIMKLVNGALEIYNEFIHPIVTWILEVLKPIISWLSEIVADVFGDIVAIVTDAISSISDIFGGLIDFFVGIFTGDLGQAFDGINSTFEGLFEGITTILKGALNVFIDVINGLIKGINAAIGVINKIPGVEIPKIKTIPRLAQGTVVPPNKEFLAVLGDNTKEHEIVSPISTMKQAFKEAMLEIGSTGKTEKEEHYYLNETELMSIMYRLVKGGERIAGTNLVSGGVY